MIWLTDFYTGLARLFGGSASVWLIFLLAIAMWALIVERYWYFYLLHEDVAAALQQRWRRMALTPALARRARKRLMRSTHADLSRSIELVRHLVVVILLLGFLGSVAGLMRALNTLGLGVGAGSEVSALAHAIAAASLPLVVAFAVVASGMYFSHALGVRAVTEAQLLRDQLRRG